MNEIINKIDEIISIIESSNEYKRYLLLKEKTTFDKDIISVINNIKNLQKEIVKLQSKGLDYSDQDKLIDDYLMKLNKYPIYVEFNYLQEDLNKIFQNIKKTIEYHINDITS